MADEGLQPTSLNSGRRSAGSVIDSEGNIVVQQCFDSEPLSIPFTESESAKALQSGVDVGVGPMEFGANVEIVKETKFTETNLVVIPLGQAVPSDSCIEQIQYSHDTFGTTYNDMVFIHETLVGVVSSQQCFQVSGGLKLFFAPKLKGKIKDWCHQYSNDPVVLGYDATSVAKLPQFREQEPPVPVAPPTPVVVADHPRPLRTTTVPQEPSVESNHVWQPSDLPSPKKPKRNVSFAQQEQNKKIRQGSLGGLFLASGITCFGIMFGVGASEPSDLPWALPVFMGGPLLTTSGAVMIGYAAKKN